MVHSLTDNIERHQCVGLISHVTAGPSVCFEGLTKGFWFEIRLAPPIGRGMGWAGSWRTVSLDTLGQAAWWQIRVRNNVLYLHPAGK
jgi:hypothetical protein